MLILGNKYAFTELELKRLNKKFDKINTIFYEQIEPQEVISQIEENIKNGFTVIVLNTKVKVDDEIIKYLTDLKFKIKTSKFKIISIEHFLEEYLYKCYIPEDNNDLHYLDDIKEFSKWQYFQKRCIDFFGVFWLFFFSWPVMLTCKKKIKEQSAGPIFYKQMRVGYANREFECIKFRSMRLDAEKDGARFASKDDDRVFPWGKVMRRTRFDELPQMLNILKGEMHLIGPRPERLVYTQQFSAEIPYYNERHLVAPGITGWAQVMYPYGENVEDARQKLMYDLFYIKHWNIWREFQIVYLTAKTVINKKGV